MDVFSIGLQGAFAAVFVVVVMRYLADPRPVHRDLVIVAASVVGWFLVSTVSSIWPEVAPSLARITPVVILAQPILTLRLVRHFVPVSRNVMLAAAAWYVFALAIVFAFGTRGNVVATGLIVAYFVVFQSASAIMLSQAAERRVGYARTRLWVASAGSLLFAATIFVAGLASAAAQAGEATDQGLVIVSRILALAAGLAYLIAFMPPQPLRRLQQRATAFDLGQSLIASQERDPDAPWQALAELAVRVTGGDGAVVATGDPPVVRAATGTVSPVAEGEGSQFEVAIGSEERVGTLRVFVDGASLFIEDDRVLLGLLGEQAARSAEYQQQFMERVVLESELEDRSHELAESQARLEGETRFRVALEAHPGILLVVDPDGSIGYANAQALASFQYAPEEIRSVPFRELLSTPAGGPTPGVHPAEARRKDGTVFPVDYALSTFEVDGATYSIAVLTDISERLQTERLRDTFIGMLSHELRTPVTAIYGGSQVLLSRGDRLDPAIRTELISDVASEAERLHRLIENLLVLARVERGQDLAGGEPVLLQRVLPLIVERERQLWPGTKIAMTLPPGLPTVRGHDGYVGQVVRNLLSNAAKYGGAGASVEIAAERGDGGVTVRVLDDGSGVAPEHADRLFDLYYRAPGAADRAPGAGIGLFVCRHIISALGGTIWARSRPEGGAEFGFELPIYEPEDEPTTEGQELGSGASPFPPAPTGDAPAAAPAGSQPPTTTPEIAVPS